MPDEPVETHVRPFADWLAEQRKGHAAAEAAAALNELIEAVQEYGKAGQMSLTIKVKPAGSGGSTVFVTDEISLRLPKSEPEAALFFVDDDNNLVRTDPRQMTIDSALRSVPDPTALAHEAPFRRIGEGGEIL